MSDKINSVKEKLINDYIRKIDTAVENYNSAIETDGEIFELVFEIANVFENDVPNLSGSLLLRTGSELRDASTTRAMLIMHLANSGIEYKGKRVEENVNEKRFWNSFIHWFETELPSMELLNTRYLHWDHWDGGTWILGLDYDHEFTLYRGTAYPDSLRNNTGDFSEIKAFIEMAYKYWVINSGECHYKFTIEVNDRFKIFKLPYRLQSGIVIKQGYKTTFPIDKIINYRMFERKIQFSEDMISSKDLMEKKSALDFIIDALQYLISTQGDSRNEQYRMLSLSVNDNMEGKVYAVVKKELDELMKFSNEYFDIRHNDYLNGAKEKREALNDSQFIEYLYNRAYAMLYLLRLKHKDIKERE
ncbi:hypothetical protein [Oribacterium sinus]|uniref:hypothetical protein n=1 Tax=Oribacterium sinus TaxID=237576 RepID=UPI0028F16BB6|nr:hypothetical protein [Oribacterium sinus]